METMQNEFEGMRDMMSTIMKYMKDNTQDEEGDHADDMNYEDIVGEDDTFNGSTLYYH